MADNQFTPIVLDPSTNSVSGPVSGLPPTPVQPQPTALVTPVMQPAQPVAQTAPLQPVPKVTTTPMTATPAVAQPTPARQAELQQQLNTLSQEESKLLGTIKDWVAWIQGAETKKQALERELVALNSQFHLGENVGTGSVGTTAAMPTTPTIDRAALEKQLREAEAKLKTVVDQQKIEEKKAFDNYSAGGINRDGLLKEMERISTFYTTPLESAKTKIAEVKNKLTPPTAVEPQASALATTTVVEAPASAQPLPTPVMPAQTAAATAPTLTNPTVSLAPQYQKILDRLRTLSAAQTGYIKQLVVDLPNQGTGLTIERAADGNGIIILAGTEQAYTSGHHFPDADLILAGLGVDDITALPTGTLIGTQITPPAQASL